MNIQRPGICFNHGFSVIATPFLHGQTWFILQHYTPVETCRAFGTKTVGRQGETNVICYSEIFQMSVIEHEGYVIIFGLWWFETYIWSELHEVHRWVQSKVCMPRLLGVIFTNNNPSYCATRKDWIIWCTLDDFRLMAVFERRIGCPEEPCRDENILHRRRWICGDESTTQRDPICKNNKNNVNKHWSVNHKVNCKVRFRDDHLNIYY